MEQPGPQVTINGAIGGFIAGAVVALWFFVVDIITTEPFYTPALLASAFLQQELLSPTIRLVTTYTVFHFGVFVVLGVGAAWFITLIRVAPSFLLGAVFGLGVLNSAHYGGLLLAESNFLTALPPVHVLGANLLGGIAMMTYLHFITHAATPLGPGALAGHRLLTQGLTTGLFGAGAVALWFLIVDILAGDPFYTPAALGSAVFFGATAPDEIQVNIAIIGAYTVLHLAAFWVVGILFVWVAERIERAPGLWLMVLMSFIVLEALFVPTVGLLSGWILGAVGWWSVAVGNLVAVATMGVRVWMTHPELKRKLVEEPVATRV